MKKIDYLSEILTIDVEPFVRLPSLADFNLMSADDYVTFNQKRRQKLKFDYFLNAFDFLTGSEIVGDYFEFGCHKARTFRMALSCAYFYKMHSMRFHAFDSFEGLPDFGDHLIEQWRPGQLATSENDFDRLIAEHNLFPNKIFKHKGFYKDLLTPSLSKTLLESKAKAAFINIDCDFYDSAVSVFNFIEPFLQHGTVLYLDDAFCAFKETSKGGVLGAFNEFQKNSSFKFVEHMSVGWAGRSYIASSC
jgi:hypothetical protein